MTHPAMHCTADEDRTLLEWLAYLAPDSSKRTLRGWLKEKRVKVDGKVVVLGARQVRRGQEVCIARRMPILSHGVSILFEDSDLVVVEKPSGILSVASDFGDEISVHSILKMHAYPRRVYPVHRLDREVSGVMLFAYTQWGWDVLKEDLRARRVVREYAAIVEGEVAEDSGSWNSQLNETEDGRVVVVTKGGKWATTHFTVVRRERGRSLLALRLDSGRKHQIRVHCREAGHPVVGDPKYGVAAQRICLHATRLTFPHPRQKRQMHFCAELPEVFGYTIADRP